MRRIKFKIKPYLRFGGSPENRVNLLQAYITALVKYERIELGYMKAYETQKYAERVSTDTLPLTATVAWAHVL